MMGGALIPKRVAVDKKTTITSKECGAKSRLRAIRIQRTPATDPIATLSTRCNPRNAYSAPSQYRSLLGAYSSASVAESSGSVEIRHVTNLTLDEL